MSVITIASNDSLTNEEKKELIKKVSKIVAEAYKIPVQTVTTFIEEYPNDNIGVGEETLTEIISKQWFLKS